MSSVIGSAVRTVHSVAKNAVHRVRSIIPSTTTTPTSPTLESCMSEEYVDVSHEAEEDKDGDDNISCDGAMVLKRLDQVVPPPITDTTLSLSQHYKTADRIYAHAHAAHQAGEIERAYIGYSHYVSFFLYTIGKHPQNKLPQFQELNTHHRQICAGVLTTIDSLRSQIHARHDYLHSQNIPLSQRQSLAPLIIKRTSTFTSTSTAPSKASSLYEAYQMRQKELAEGKITPKSASTTSTSTTTAPPATIDDPNLHQHTLTYHPHSIYVNGRFTCMSCKQEKQGGFYHCKNCGTIADRCIKCAMNVVNKSVTPTSTSTSTSTSTTVMSPRPEATTPTSSSSSTIPSPSPAAQPQHQPQSYLGTLNSVGYLDGFPIASSHIPIPSPSPSSQPPQSMPILPSAPSYEVARQPLPSLPYQPSQPQSQSQSQSQPQSQSHLPSAPISHECHHWLDFRASPSAPLGLSQMTHPIQHPSLRPIITAEYLKCMDCHLEHPKQHLFVCVQCLPSLSLRCGRHRYNHSLSHATSCAHELALNLATNTLWCYVCEQPAMMSTSVHAQQVAQMVWENQGSAPSSGYTLATPSSSSNAPTASTSHVTPTPTSTTPSSRPAPCTTSTSLISPTSTFRIDNCIQQLLAMGFDRESSTETSRVCNGDLSACVAMLAPENTDGNETGEGQEGQPQKSASTPTTKPTPTVASATSTPTPASTSASISATATSTSISTSTSTSTSSISSSSSISRPSSGSVSERIAALNRLSAENADPTPRRRNSGSPSTSPAVTPRLTPTLSKQVSRVDDDCVVCLEKPKVCVMVPCGHQCCCMECGENLKNAHQPCPICRGEISMLIKPYKV